MREESVQLLKALAGSDCGAWRDGSIVSPVLAEPVEGTTAGACISGRSNDGVSRLTGLA